MNFRQSQIEPDSESRYSLETKEYFSQLSSQWNKSFDSIYMWSIVIVVSNLFANVNTFSTLFVCKGGQLHFSQLSEQVK